MGYRLLTTVNFIPLLSETHLLCSLPQYIYLSGVLGFIAAAIFLKLAALAKLILMILMTGVYIGVMEYTHKTIFDDFDIISRYNVICVILVKI